MNHTAYLPGVLFLHDIERIPRRVAAVNDDWKF